MITPATAPKMPMQIAVVNQYTRVIRSICTDAESGSHWISSATRVTTPAAASPYSEMRKIDPLRTARETTSPADGGRVASEPVGAPDLRSEILESRRAAHAA